MRTVSLVILIAAVLATAVAEATTAIFYYVAYTGIQNTAQNSNQSTRTLLSCTPNTISVNQSTSCTVFVIDMSQRPTFVSGTVSFWTNNNTGGSDFVPTINCNLVAAFQSSGCTELVTAKYSGQLLVWARYGGEKAHAASNSLPLTIVVIGENAHSTMTNIDCSPSSIRQGQSTTCVARVTDTSLTPTTPTGWVTLLVGNNDYPCNLGKITATTASCSVIVSPESTEIVIATYSADTNHDTSNARTTVPVY